MSARGNKISHWRLAADPPLQLERPHIALLNLSVLGLQARQSSFRKYPSTPVLTLSKILEPNT